MKSLCVTVAALAVLGASHAALAQQTGLPGPVPAGELITAPEPAAACEPGVSNPAADCAGVTTPEVVENSADLSTGVLSNTIVGTGNVSAISAARYDANRLAQEGAVNMDMAVGDVSSTVVGEGNQATTELFTIDPDLIAPPNQ